MRTPLALVIALSTVSVPATGPRAPLFRRLGGAAGIAESADAVRPAVAAPAVAEPRTAGDRATVAQASLPDGATTGITSDMRPDTALAGSQPWAVAGVKHVRINERLGTIAVTGDVEISPVVLTVRGLTINTATPVSPAAGWDVPQAARLQDLLEALDELNVSPEDRVAILKELHAAGKLHASLILQ